VSGDPVAAWRDKPGVEVSSRTRVGIGFAFAFTNGWTVEVELDEFATRTWPLGYKPRLLEGQPLSEAFRSFEVGVRTWTPAGEEFDEESEMGPELLAGYLAVVASLAPGGDEDELWSALEQSELPFDDDDEL
jgi:hypothetical protein